MEKIIIDEYDYFKNGIGNRNAKIEIAKKIAEKVKDGDVIGFGSGSTSFLTVKEIAEKIKEKKMKIIGIPTSYEIKMLCAKLEIPTASLIERKPNWSFDGTDEYNDEGWLIKGRGAAMFKEKMNILNSDKVYILADQSKYAYTLGEKFPIPVECSPESINYVKNKLFDLGAIKCDLRIGEGKDGPVITENGNFILDVRFGNIGDELEKNIKLISGVIETGLFIGYKNIEIIKI